MEKTDLLFKNIRAESKSENGAMKVTNSVMMWKANNDSTNVITLKVSDALTCEWLRMGKFYELRVHDPGSKIEKFGGFEEQDYEALQKMLLGLKKRDFATKGWHWGEFIWENERNLVISNGGGNLLMDVPASMIVNASTPSKTDLQIELHSRETNDDQDSVCEIRFYFPPKSGEEESREGEEDYVTELKDVIVDKANLAGSGADIVALLVDIPLLVPRGRYEVEMFKKSMKLHGKTFDYTIPYSWIDRLFMLPKSDGMHICFVIALNNPVKHGQTRYPFLVFQFHKEKEAEINLNISEAEIETTNEDGKFHLQKVMSGPLYTIMADILRAFSKKPIFVPKDFKSAAGNECIRCSHKANEGFMYPLKRCLIVIPKPVIFIHDQDILSVEFSRAGGAQTRFFEMKISCRRDEHFEFSQIEKNEYKPLTDWLNAKHIKIINLQDQQADSNKKIDEGSEGEDESTDEDFDDDENASDTDESMVSEDKENSPLSVSPVSPDEKKHKHKKHKDKEEKKKRKHLHQEKEQRTE